MSQSSPPTLDRLDHIVLTVADMAATLAFYGTILGMRAERFDTPDGSTRQALFFGRSKINLHQQGAELDPRAVRPTPGSADLCFITRTPLEVWTDHLKQHGVDIEQGPVARTGATGPLLSIYLRDPDRNLIEISTSDHRA